MNKDSITNRKFLEEETDYYMTRLGQPDYDIDYILEPKEGNDWFRADLEDGKGTITANTPIALLIGLYRYLNHAGLRFLRPGRENEFWPDHSDLSWHTEETASYKHRGVCIEGADSFKNITDFIDWLPKISMNSFFIQFENPYSFLKRWYEHEFNPYQEKEPFSSEIAQEMSDRIDQEISKRGLIHHRVGHGWTGEVLGYSSRYGWEKGLELPEEKKPLAALVNGKRELIDGAPILTSLDFSNTQVEEMMSESILNYAAEHPEVDCLHVWLSDANNNICECEECRKERVADQYIRILNRTDEKLTEAGLDTRICFLLYHELLWAPEHESLKNPDRFVMMFAPISRTFEKSYADVDYSALPEPAEYIRNRITLPSSLEENLSYLNAWQKMFTGDSFVYDYPLGRAHYGDLGYMKISRTISRDDRFLKNLGLDGCISCQELRAGFPTNLPDYTMGATLWNADLEFEEIRDSYMQAMYGEDWKGAVSYLETLSAMTSCDHFNAIGDRIDPELVLRYHTAFHTAKNALPMIRKNIIHTDGLQKKQWKLLDLHRTYVILLSQALRGIASGDAQEAQSMWQSFLNWIRLHENEIQPELDVYRVVEVAKNYAGFRLEDE